MKRLVAIVLLAVVLTGLWYVFSDSRSDTSFSTTIVTSLYPLTYFTERVVGEVVTVQHLGGAQDPHHYTPTRADIDAMRNASLVILQGAGMESWGGAMETQLAEANVPVLVVAEALGVVPEHNEEEDHESETDEEHNENEEGHGDDHHHEYDPHTWLDPLLAQNMVRHITEALITTFPEHEEAFATNARTLTKELEILHETYTTRLSTCTAPATIISHDSAGYIGTRYNLIFYPIAGISTEDEPSAQTLTTLSGRAREGVIAILTEESAVTEYSEMLSRTTGLTILPFNPLGRGPLVEGKEYFDVMYDNLESLTTAFACTL